MDTLSGPRAVIRSIVESTCTVGFSLHGKSLEGAQLYEQYNMYTFLSARKGMRQGEREGQVMHMPTTVQNTGPTL